MDIMNSKKTLLSLINGGAVLGAPAGGNTVKFQFATSIATAAASQTAGALTFAADSNGNAAIYAQGTLVSSKIQNVAAAAAADNKHGGKTITVTYIGAAGAIQTATFDVIDEAGLEAYFAQSKTITLDTSTFEVKTKANGGLAVDNNDGLYVNVGDFFAVDGSTIVQDSTSKKISTALGIEYVANVPGGAAAHIALVDNAGNEIDKVEVSDIIGNGIVDHTEYVSATNTLKIFFKKADGTLNEVDVDLSDLFDIDDWAVKSDSEEFLSMTINSSEGTAEIGVKKADVTFTAKSGNIDASLTVDTTNGEILVASDAIPAIVEYVKATQGDNGISAEGDSYIDASVDATDNKKINIEAQTANLTVAKVDTADTTIAGTAGKLVDAADAATKTASFVNARIAEEIDKLGKTADSSAEFVKVVVTTENGDVSTVTVTETKSTITASASTLSATAGIADGQEFAAGVKVYIDGRLDASIQALDASITADTTAHDISIYLEEVDGVVTTVGVEHTAATVTFTAAEGGQPANLEGSGSFVMASDIATIKDYVDAVAGALDSSVEDTDNGKGYVYVKTVQENGALDEQIVNVTYGEITAAAGAIQIDANGIIDSSVLKEAIEGALVWTVLP